MALPSLDDDTLNGATKFAGGTTNYSLAFQKFELNIGSGFQVNTVYAYFLARNGEELRSVP